MMITVKIANFPSLVTTVVKVTIFSYTVITEAVPPFSLLTTRVECLSFLGLRHGRTTTQATSEVTIVMETDINGEVAERGHRLKVQTRNPKVFTAALTVAAGWK
jgi:hypothetical protein